MDEYNDKDQTIEFRPQKDDKEYISRGEENIYSEGRKSNVHYEDKKESGSKALIYTALILAILLVIAVTVGLIILNMDNSDKEKEIPQNQETVLDIEEDEEIEEEIAEEEVINFYNVVFYGDSVIKTEDGYSILADLYDESFSQKKDNRKLFINEETDIRENGQRLSAQGLVYAVESMAGEGVIFEAKIRESDDVAISISYEGSFEEELNPPEEENPEENNEEIPPAEEENSGEEPIVGEEQSGVIVE